MLLSRFFLCLGGLSGLGACVALPNSDQRLGEKLTMRVLERPEPLAFSKLQTQLMASRGKSRGMALSLLNKAAPLLVQGIQELIKRDQAKYTAEYRFKESNRYFYDSHSTQNAMDPQNLKFQGLEFNRSIQLSKRDTAKVSAMRVQLEMLDDPASQYALLYNSVFQLKVKELDLAHAKAKVPAARWYLPWTLMYRREQYLNLDLTVQFLGSWIGADGTIRKDQPLGSAVLSLRDVPLADTAALRAYEQKQAGRVLQGYFHVVPRSTGSYLDAQNAVQSGFGQGVYSVEATVSETGKTNFINKAIFDNKKELNRLPQALK